jgi:hypothetical protein
MMKTTLCFVVLQLCLAFNTLAQNKRYTISGFIRDGASSELMIGASIAIPKYKTGTVSNAYGFYSITLPEDSFEMVVSYMGYTPKAFRINLNADQSINVALQESKNSLDEVVITDKKQIGIANQSRMSVIEIPIQQVKDIPALFGEKDVLKVIQLLPGVQKGSEGNSGIYVRGGGPDQNLIILDDAIVYNAFHLFGFFSLFNGDALKNVELTKGGFPARYGGRLSSVIDMNMKEGNKNKFKGEAGIGIISSRFVLEGPIVKGKSSFIVSARRTYIDLLMKPFFPQEFSTGYYFYDFNAKVNYEINEKNKIYLSGYFGRDNFYFRTRWANETYRGGIGWGNATGTLRWNHLYNNKIFSNTSLIVTNYQFRLFQEMRFNNFTYKQENVSGISDITFKHDFDYRPAKNHLIKTGVMLTRHLFVPQSIVTRDDLTNQNTRVRSQIESFENAAYIEDDWQITPHFKTNLGMRFSHFHAQGKNYVFAEPRISSVYMLKDDLSLKASYANMNQFVHLLSNTGVGLPTDLWVPSTRNIRPQQSWQIAAGVAKDFLERNFSLTIEGYYKEMNNIIQYREGASFLDIDPSRTQDNPFSWEENITAGRGWSYGTEFLLQRKVGKFTGWVGYTLSWTQLQFDELNGGEKFWARYDRRHDISLVGMYEIRKVQPEKNGIHLSATWVYGTGNAITLPIASHHAPTHRPGVGNQWSGGGIWGETVSQYTARNDFRMAPFHRLDVGVQVSKKMKYWVRTWEFSIYNLYNRYNPYFYYIDYVQSGNTSRAVLKQVSLFPMLPSATWSIKF